MTMGAANFTAFVVAYFVELFMTLALRLYVEPGLNAVLALIPKWVSAVVFDYFRCHCCACTQRAVLLVQKIQLKRFWRKNRVLMTREQRKAEDMEWKRILEDIARETEGVEPIIASYYSYANGFTALMLSPMVQFFLLLTDTNGVQVTQLPFNYQISPTNLQYYTIFSCIIMLFQVCLQLAVDCLCCIP